MIVIKNRELLIPENEQFIGTVYDNNSDIRYFRIDRLLPGQVDISNFTFAADVKYSNGATDSISLTKETVAEDYLVLRMQIPSTVVAGHAGNMGIQVRCSDLSGRTWSTAPANMYIMDQISNPGAVTASTTLTELQQTETAIEASEALRISAESARATAETGRVNAETARVNAESSRVTAEGLRVSAETARASAETGRVNAESSRVSAETSRASAESSRVSAENARVSAENARVIAENGRVTAEAARESAEAAREASLATKSLVSEGWAKGTQNDVPVTEESPYYHDNSKYHKEQADAKRLVAEGFANGQQNGVDVGPGSPYYHNNAKYFMEEAGSASGFVSYVVDQQLSDEAKQIARNNIGAYKKAASGIPSSDMTSAVQTSLGKADTAYQKAATGIPSTDMTAAVQTSLEKADTALQEHQSLDPYRTSANQDVIDATLQPKTDSSLTTTAQTVVGAINEHESDISQLNTDKADKVQLSNRNLLDNPWFTVNQRGQSSYTAFESYTVDRWMASGTSTYNCVVEPVSNGIKLSKGNNTGWRIEQKLEDYVLTVGETYTVSINVVSLESQILVYLRHPNTYIGTITTTGISSFTFTMPSGIANPNIMLQDLVSSTYSIIRAVKLEKGSVSTLHMDTAPNYAEELLKCQRYFVRTILIGRPSTSNGSQFDFCYKTNMKVVPSFVINGSSCWTNATRQTFTVSSISSQQVNNGYILFNVNGAYSGSDCNHSTHLDFNVDLVADL